jgi:hypothetical protein
MTEPTKEQGQAFHMPQFKLPAHRRKPNPHRSPKGDQTRINGWALGHARATMLVASCERAGHQTIVARIQHLMRTSLLTTEQTEACYAELYLRKKLIDACTRLISNSQTRINQQYDKEVRYVPIEERRGWVVPGPHAQPVPVVVKVHIKATDKGVAKLSLKSDSGRDKTRKVKFDTDTLTGVFK